MRQLKTRPGLASLTLKKLASSQSSLLRCSNPKAKCEERFNNARKSSWFAPIRIALQDMAGKSRTCMFCDHNEPTDVEHFHPKSEFPEKAFSWANMLWLCTTCNRLKGAKFPPHNCSGVSIIDPSVENGWDFFFIDEFGNLIKR